VPRRIVTPVASPPISGYSSDTKTDLLSPRQTVTLMTSPLAATPAQHIAKANATRLSLFIRISFSHPLYLDFVL
jgi:hypothetical protein